MKLSVILKKLQPRNPFRIARGEKRFVENVFVRLEDGGLYGYGEASPNSFYAESADLVYRKLCGIDSWLTDKKITSLEDINRLWREVWRYLQPSRAAQCALDIALYDLLGKKLNSSVSKLLWSESPKKILTSCTLGICERNEWQERVDELQEYPVLKIKMDHTGDVGFLSYVRSHTEAAIRVDANCSWAALDMLELITKLKTLRVEFVEQPLPPEDTDRMSAILEKASLPILADESSRLVSDVSGLEGKFSGINIKLVKCGGLTPGLEMFYRAKRLGMSVMVGCMLESNVLIAAGAALAQRTEYADLDGSWLLTDRVFEGVEIERGELVVSGESGLGVEPGSSMAF